MNLSLLNADLYAELQKTMSIAKGAHAENLRLRKLCEDNGISPDPQTETIPE